MVSLGLSLTLVSETKGDTTLVAWGSSWDGDHNVYVPVTVPTNLTNVIAVTAGFQHYVCLSRDGKVTGVAQSWDAQANIPPSATNPIAFAAGYYDSALIDSVGDVHGLGGPMAPPSHATNIVAIS